MSEEIYLDDIPESAQEEISFLYKIGIGIEDLEYLISLKMREIH